MTGRAGLETPNYVLASAAFGHRTRTVTIGLFRHALRWKPQPEAGQYMPKRRAVVRERLDRWLKPTPVPQRNTAIADAHRTQRGGASVSPALSACAGQGSGCHRALDVGPRI